MDYTKPNELIQIFKAFKNGVMKFDLKKYSLLNFGLCGIPVN